MAQGSCIFKCNLHTDYMSAMFDLMFVRITSTRSTFIYKFLRSVSLYGITFSSDFQAFKRHGVAQ
jgi:hypothetical protein